MLLSMFCMWFVTLWKSSFPRNPPTPWKLLPFNPPSPSEFPIVFRGGGMDIFWNHTMCSDFNFWTQSQMGIEVFGSLLYSERFFSKYLGFLLSSNLHIWFQYTVSSIAIFLVFKHLRHISFDIEISMAKENLLFQKPISFWFSGWHVDNKGWRSEKYRYK